MPLTRTHFRSKSRSPAPNAVGSITTANLSSRTPVFHPPSYYAAAAGIVLQDQALPANIVATSPAWQSHPSPASPLSYPTQTQVTESSSSDSTPSTSTSHFNRVSRLISRTPSRSSSSPPHRSNSKSSRHDKEKGLGDRRKSQFVDLPLVEMQLIPSLRDTVDKMTHPIPNSKHDESEDEFAGVSASVSVTPDAHADSATRIPPPPSTQPAPASTAMSKLSMPYSKGTETAPGYSRIPHFSSPTTIPKLSNTPKTVMKSALRAQASPSVAKDSLPNTCGVQSLRRTKPLNVRPTASPAFAYSANPAIDSKSSSEILAHPRRFVNQGTGQGGSLLPLPKTSKSHPNTPQAPQNFRDFATPQPLQSSVLRSPYASKIRSYIPRPGASSASSSDSGSELERRVDRYLNPGRLVVTNAQIVPSSSESTESDDDVLRSQQSWIAGRQDRPTPPSGIPVRGTQRELAEPQSQRSIRFSGHDSGKRPIGLGFELETALDRGQQHIIGDADEERDTHDDFYTGASMSRVQAHMKQQEEDEGSMYEEETTPDSLTRSRLLDAVTSYSPAAREDDAQKREEALMDIVDGLQADYGTYSPSGRRSVLSQSESDAYYEQGLAITASSDLPDVSTRNTSLGDTRGSFSHLTRRSWEESVYDEEQSNYSEEDRGDDLFEDEDSHRDVQWRQSQQVARGFEHASPSKQGRADEIQQSRAPTWMKRHSGFMPQPASPREPTVLSSPHSESGRRRQSASRRTSQVGDRPLLSTSQKRRSVYDSEDTLTPRMSYKEQGTPFDSSGKESADISDARNDMGDREREAFGIPRSLSYGASDSPGDAVPDRGGVVHRQSTLLRSESDDSIIGGPQVASRMSSTEGKGILSRGAHALFEVLAEGERSSSSHGSEGRPWSRQGYDSASGRRSPLERNSVQHLEEAVTPVRNSRSMYEEYQPELRPVSPLLLPQSTWRSSLQPAVYNSLLSRYGQIEMQRQELIYELLKTERMIVKRLRVAVKSFILPLRCQNSKSWLPGVPQEASRVFDWLEDIMNLHVDITNVLKAISRDWKVGSIVDMIGEPLLSIVQRLEVYQPYLIRVDEVKELVVGCVDDPQSEFGEYIRMREQEGMPEGWTLEKFLDEPIGRLHAYADIFEKLLSMTPKRHPDHLPTYSLLCTTKTIISVMQEVCVREEEYDFVRDVASHISGLPSSASIAKRERRLLHHGLLQLLRPRRLAPEGAVQPTVRVNGKPLQDEWTLKDASQRASRLASAIHKWHVRRARTDSISSISSSSLSFQSCDSVSSSSMASTVAACCRQRLDVDVTPLHAFVFSDVIVLVTAASVKQDSSGAEYQDGWHLLQDIGLSRILCVTAGNSASADGAITLDLLPVDIHQLESSLRSKAGLVVDISVVLPDTPEDSRRDWLAALQQCQQNTVHSLVFPTHIVDSESLHGADLDLKNDSYRAVKSIVASGLPFPKSPSMQLEDQSSSRSGDSVEQEREERGWWSLRFQQVLREFQRQGRTA
ncbi:uncharacterized protein FIBRA_00497 [Fibroporia radiculosa]|uniref:DH domain-containing protein n=1 Tax=Fibroporia radiculosa TaxID=599839 RepID=J4H040_9APHY|nr:uncharacterized protein FIBRA_00497 [Fibroporia radiculosa]CCL98499.1 predicted protein [Fibroporia radiculosa]